jgi:hypothetical protein
MKATGIVRRIDDLGDPSYATATFRASKTPIDTNRQVLCGDT